MGSVCWPGLMAALRAGDLERTAHQAIDSKWFRKMSPPEHLRWRSEPPIGRAGSHAICIPQPPLMRHPRPLSETDVAGNAESFNVPATRPGVFRSREAGRYKSSRLVARPGQCPAEGSRCMRREPPSTASAGIPATPPPPVKPLTACISQSCRVSLNLGQIATSAVGTADDRAAQSRGHATTLTEISNSDFALAQSVRSDFGISRSLTGRYHAPESNTQCSALRGIPIQRLPTPGRLSDAGPTPSATRHRISTARLPGIYDHRQMWQLRAQPTQQQFQVVGVLFVPWVGQPGFIGAMANPLRTVPRTVAQRRPARDRPKPSHSERPPGKSVDASGSTS